jgi:hypothetical protein
MLPKRKIKKKKIFRGLNFVGIFGEEIIFSKNAIFHKITKIPVKYEI